MPLPAAAALVAGTAAAGSLGNIATTWIQNKKSRDFSKKMYDRQYRDNIAFWRMQNEYNSPEKQMERLRNAGLNPNLVYGQGARGATGQADKIATPDVQTPQFRTPDLSGIQGAGLAYMNAMYDFDIKQAQYDNLKAQNSQILAETALKTATAGMHKATTARSKFDLEFEMDLRDISAEARKQAVRQMTKGTDVVLRRDEREAAMNSSNLAEARERILRMREEVAKSVQERKRIRAEINNKDADTVLKRLDAELWEQGISRSDPLWMRVLVRHLEEILTTANKIPW